MRNCGITAPKGALKTCTSVPLCRNSPRSDLSGGPKKSKTKGTYSNVLVNYRLVSLCFVESRCSPTGRCLAISHKGVYSNYVALNGLGFV